MSFNMISIFSNRKWFYWLIPIAMMMLMIAGCASDEDDGGTTTTTPSTSSATTLLSGTVQTSTATSSSIDVLSSYSADHVSYAEVGSSCTVQALDSSTEKVIATTTSDSSGGYSFTDAQISANKTYKILTTCANKKMSTYVSTGKTVVVQNVSPATTASSSTRRRLDILLSVIVLLV